MRSADRAVLRAYLASLQALDPTRYPRPEQLRPIWRDPRTHYALNCASIGCPNLAGRAYTGITWSGCSKRAPATTSTTRAAPRGRMASFAPPVSTTGIRKTSAGRRPGYWAILLRYARPELAERLRGYVGLMDYDYDWSLNEP